MPFKALAGQKKSLSAKTLRNVKALLICLRCTELVIMMRDGQGMGRGDLSGNRQVSPLSPIRKVQERGSKFT